MWGVHAGSGEQLDPHRTYQPGSGRKEVCTCGPVVPLHTTPCLMNRYRVGWLLAQREDQQIVRTGRLAEIRHPPKPRPQNTFPKSYCRWRWTTASWLTHPLQIHAPVELKRWQQSSVWIHSSYNGFQWGPRSHDKNMHQNHPLITIFRFGKWWQKDKQGSPYIFLPSIAPQFFLGCPKGFLSLKGHNIPSVSPRSDPCSPPSQICMGYLPIQIRFPNQLYYTEFLPLLTHTKGMFRQKVRWF